MSAIVVEQGLAAALAGAPPAGLVVVPRSRGRRGWEPLSADAVVASLDVAGPHALVLARPAASDPGAAALPALAAVMRREIVRLPGDPDAAAWVAGIAPATGSPAGGAARRLQVLVGAAASPVLPRRPVGAGAARVPAVRPGVLARWAACVWRPCPRCAGGGLPGAACGRCGAGLAAAGAR